MENSAILYPMLALAAWTLIVLALVPIARIRAARRLQVSTDDFRYGESPAVPPELTLPNRNYMNLLELPVLFYALCLIAYATASASTLIVTLAWCFVGSRVIHTAIHLSYNNVLHRLAAFASGAAVLAVLLGVIGISLAGK